MSRVKFCLYFRVQIALRGYDFVRTMRNMGSFVLLLMQMFGVI